MFFFFNNWQGKWTHDMSHLGTVRLMEYGIKEINRELFEIEAEHFESSILFKIVVKRVD